MTHFLIKYLKDYYGIEATELTLLPIGADRHASIYKAQARDRKTYFVKLKHGHSLTVDTAILEFLQISGIKQFIPPVKTKTGKQTQQVGDSTLIVYPFVHGQDGFNRSLTDEQWIALGRGLSQVHEIDVPAYLKTKIRRECFSPKYRETVRSLFESELNGDTVTGDFWKFIQENRAIVQRLVERAEKLSEMARREPLNFVFCHSDIHGGNVLVDDAEALYIVDWDDPILAPKECDLMFIGGGVGNVWNKRYEEKLFYQGYGPTEINWILLTYYRYERIVEDIAEYSEEFLQTTTSKDRLEMNRQFRGMFAPNGVVDKALETDNQRQQFT